MTAGSAARAVLGQGPVPKHVQLSRILRELVTEQLAPDSPLPSERELMSRYGVSRATVRTAVGQLVTEGRLYRVPARGTFVASPRVESQLHLASFTQDMRRRGLEPSTVVLSAVPVADPPPPVSAALRLPAGEGAYRLERLRRAAGAPMAHEVGWYPEAVLPGLLDRDLTGSVYELLATAYRLVIETGRQTVWAENAEPEMARLLGTHTGAALLVFTRTSHAGELPVEHVTSWYRGDRYQVHMALDRQAAGGAPTSEGVSR